MSDSLPTSRNSGFPYKLPLVIKEERHNRWIEDADGIPVPPAQLVEAINLVLSEKREPVAWAIYEVSTMELVELSIVKPDEDPAIYTRPLYAADR